MTEYNSLNVKLSNSEVKKLISAINNAIEVTLKLSSNIIGDSNDETNFPNKLFLNDGQVSKFCKAFVNNSSANIKLSKTQLSKILQSGGFLDRFLGLLLKTGLSLIQNVLKQLAKSLLISLGLTAATSAKKIHKNFFKRNSKEMRKKKFIVSRSTLIFSKE